MLRNIITTPRQEGESCRGVGWDYFLVEADAGVVGFLLCKRQAVNFDDVWIVTLCLVEGVGEVLDAVFGAELHEEVGKLPKFGRVPFYIVGRGDSAEQHVVGAMGGSARGRQDYERHGKGCIFRRKIGAVGVVLIADLLSRSAEVVVEIFLDVGEGCFQPRIAYA